ncbi:MAG: hypothetical protein ACRDSS_15785, partial [Actinocrinis sp.]
WSVPQGGGDSGSFAPPPVDPQYGAPAPQYGAQAPQAPQAQPQFGAPAPQYGAPAPQYGDTGQNQYGAPVPPYGAPQPQFGGPGQVPPGYGYPTEPQKNGFAVAGFILSILPLLGIIFSILGLTRAPRVGGKGRGLSIAGLILSVAFIAGYVAIGVSVGNSTALDPGCRSAENSFQSQLDTISSDESKLNADTGNSAALKTDLATFATEIQNLKTSLDTAQGQAQHQEVKDKIKAMDDDMTTVLSGLQAIQKGDTSQLDAFSAAASRLGTDGTAIDDICGKF